MAILLLKLSLNTKDLDWLNLAIEVWFLAQVNLG